MDKYDGLAHNIKSVTYGITRPRFELRDENFAKADILKRTDIVVNILIYHF